jgi:hypothetical protein
LSNLKETMDKIRTERLRLRSFPVFEKGYSNKNSNSELAEILKNEDIHKSLDNVDRLLSELKINEPNSDDKFFRLSIIAYEIGDLHRAIVYANRFKDNEKMRIAHLAHGKLALADALAQIYLLCLSLGWDFNKLRELGALHLQERHEDFKRDGWSELK